MNIIPSWNAELSPNFYISSSKVEPSSEIVNIVAKTHLSVRTLLTKDLVREFCILESETPASKQPASEAIPPTNHGLNALISYKFLY